jgi:site-specific DNA-methyltransferase (adenine-specific)
MTAFSWHTQTRVGIVKYSNQLYKILVEGMKSSALFDRRIDEIKDIILHGDTYACLEQLEDNLIAVTITSPPYWKQRDYGFEEQIGQEKTPEAYIGRLIAIYGKLKEKLRSDGVFFLNIGDKYLGQYGKSNLLQIPYRLAYHMVKNGWYLEDIVIWFKPNHMPSSVKDRFANTYEPILVLTKSRNNIYRKGLKNVIKIPLQQTPWRHTAVFPERLIEEMLGRVSLIDGDLVLDPFAGTGTVAYVVKEMRKRLFPKNVSTVMIERGDEFTKIIQERTGIREIKEVTSSPYFWKPVQEEKLPDLAPNEILQNKNGEVFVAQNSFEFLSALKGITTDRFKKFHRGDAIYFFGVKNWSIEDLYFVSQIFQEGYVLRNMLIIAEKSGWYPIFMFARDSTVVAYKFYLDRVRTRPKTEEDRDWSKENFVGMKVSDISGKMSKKGWIVKVIEQYDNGFPKIVVVKWDGCASVEMILNPDNDESLMEGLVFKCPKCNALLEELYDPMAENLCPNCGLHLWKDLTSIPRVEEPNEITKMAAELSNADYTPGEIFEIEKVQERKNTTSKFAELERINWGASPGARKIMLGEYFTKMRLYRVDQPTIAQYLTLLRKSKGLSVQDIIDKLPNDYKHTVGHWFRKDFGGSIPVPEDVKILKKILGVKDSLLKALERTTLKFQTVTASTKGKNPGDFIECENEENLISYLRKLFVPSCQYIQIANY